MKVRLAIYDDIPDMVEVERSSGDLFAGTHMDWAVGQVTPAKELQQAVARRDAWVVEDGGAIVAALIGDRMDGDFYVDQLSVTASHQRRRLGARLIEEVLAEAQRRGHRCATLTTDRSLSWNAPYYARLSFRILEPAETPPELAARLASQPNPERRCAMLREL